VVFGEQILRLVLEKVHRALLHWVWFHDDVPGELYLQATAGLTRPLHEYAPRRYDVIQITISGAISARVATPGSFWLPFTGLDNALVTD
jgi:hypothetical protein